MFETLSNKFYTIFKNFRNKKYIDKSTIDYVLKDIKIALLEADVNFKVVKDLVIKIKEKSIKLKIYKSLTPSQQMIKIVYEYLVKIMEDDQNKLNLNIKLSPAIILLTGLQGSGKTTTAVKLAKYLEKFKKKICLSSVDIYRPAAINQLKILSKINKIFFYDFREINKNYNIHDICYQSIENTKKFNYDVLILDTAGRFHTNKKMMNELKEIKDIVNPVETLFVADVMTGQEAITIASKFHEIINIDGVILTKIDSDARGGIALSLKSLLDKPIKFLGTGENIESLEKFSPERVASRILGMGDLRTFVEKTKTIINQQENKNILEKNQEKLITLNDYYTSLKQIKNFGSLKDIFSIIPGIKNLNTFNKINYDNKQIIKAIAIIDSMTIKERQNYLIINGQRRKRIAYGSGTTIQDVNQFLKSFIEMRKVFKTMKKGGLITSFFKKKLY